MFRRGKLTFLSTKDDRIRIINERINLTERHLMEICATFAGCSRKMAKYRDAYDELGHKLKNFADEEKINCSLSDGLGAITNSITVQADYMDALVHRIEAKIVNEFAQFENLCKITRESLRNATIARDKEVLKQQQLREIKSKFSSNNSAADAELLKAKLEVNRCNKEIDDIVNNFEKRKLADLKGVLTDFILISIKYHSKALEVLSASYYDVSTIDEKGDLIEFQNALKTNSKPEPKERKLALKRGLRSQSMDSLDHSRLLSPLKRHTKVARSNKSLAGKTDDELEDDEEEDEDDDEEDEDEETEDNTNGEENSGSVSENDDASHTMSDGQSTNQGDNFKKAKHQVKLPFKAAAVTHVSRQTKPFTIRSGVGIPALSKPSSALFSSKEVLKGTGNTAKAIDGANSRTVTVVESKSKPSVHYAGATGVIDQTKGVPRADGNSSLD